MVVGSVVGGTVAALVAGAGTSLVGGGGLVAAVVGPVVATTVVSGGEGTVPVVAAAVVATTFGPVVAMEGPLLISGSRALSSVSLEGPVVVVEASVLISGVAVVGAAEAGAEDGAAGGTVSAVGEGEDAPQAAKAPIRQAAPKRRNRSRPGRRGMRRLRVRGGPSDGSGRPNAPVQCPPRI